MRYLLLAYVDERRLAQMPESERLALVEACASNDAALRARGQLLAVAGLLGSDTATTVRVQSGRAAISDGPVAQAPEQLLGLFFIDARDLNEAIQLAAQMPQARGGPIEVRPLAAQGEPIATDL